MMGGIDPQAGISRWKMVKPDEEVSPGLLMHL